MIASCAEEAREIARKEKRHVLFGVAPSRGLSDAQLLRIARNRQRDRLLGAPSCAMPDLRLGGLSPREVLRRYKGARFLTTDLISYPGQGTAITITLNSLASSTTVGRQSTVVDNSTNKYDDHAITLIISTSASAIASSKTVICYVSGSFDGTNFDQDDGVMGATDAAYTINSPTNLKQGLVMYTPTSSKVYNGTFTIAGFWNGSMPAKYAIVVCNDTNQLLLGSGNSANWTGLTTTNS